MEVWKAHPELNGFKVSSFGRILVDPIEYELPNGGFRSTKPKPTLGSLSSKGKGSNYMFYKFYNRRLRVNKNVAVIVAQTFLQDSWFKGAVVMHKDDDPLNNHVDNLKWGTQKENLNTESFISYCKSRLGDESPFRKGMLRSPS